MRIFLLFKGFGGTFYGHITIIAFAWLCSLNSTAIQPGVKALISGSRQWRDSFYFIIAGYDVETNFWQTAPVAGNSIGIGSIDSCRHWHSVGF